MTRRPAIFADFATEDEWKATVVSYATLRGWLVHHDRRARTRTGWRTPIEGHPGFPDLVLARGDRLVFAELKTHRGTLSVTQRRWLDTLLGADRREVYVWRPADWPTVEDLLR